MIVRSIDRTVLYRSIDGGRIEHARLRLGDAGGVVDGTIVGVFADDALRIRHEYTCDSRWHVRNASIEVLAAGRGILALSADDDGIWRRVDGGVLDVPLFNCFDVAVELTPLPVALTLRRLALRPREAAIVNVASIAIPSLAVRMIEHRYTRLEPADGMHRYRLENFDSGEGSLITLDSDGVVAAYEAAYTRLWPER